METKTVMINGRPYAVEPGAPASEIKRRAGIGAERVLVARRPDGTLEVTPDYRPLPGRQAIDAPRFIFG